VAGSAATQGAGVGAAPQRLQVRGGRSRIVGSVGVESAPRLIVNGHVAHYSTPLS